MEALRDERRSAIAGTGSPYFRRSGVKQIFKFLGPYELVLATFSYGIIPRVPVDTKYYLCPGIFTNLELRAAMIPTVVPRKTL